VINFDVSNKPSTKSPSLRRIGRGLSLQGYVKTGKVDSKRPDRSIQITLPQPGRDSEPLTAPRSEFEDLADQFELHNVPAPIADVQK
jgi:hypothetical protein